MDSQMMRIKERELESQAQAQAAALWLLADFQKNQRHKLPSTEAVAENVRLIKDAITAGAFSADKTSRLMTTTDRLGARLNRHAALQKLTRLAQTSAPRHIFEIKSAGAEVLAQFAAGSAGCTAHAVPKKLAAKVDEVVRQTTSRFGYADAVHHPGLG